MATYSNAQTSDAPLYMRDVAEYEKELNTPPAAPSDEDDTLPPADLTPEEKVDWKKRYGDVKSHADRQLNAKADELRRKDEELVALKAQLNRIQSEPVTLPLSEAELQTWIQSFPDFEKVLRTFFIKNNQEILEKVNARASETENLAKELAKDKAWAELLRVHPDARELNSNPRFLSWVDSQEPEIRALISSEDPRKASKGLDIYKQFAGIKTKTPQEQAKDNSRNVVASSKADTPHDKRRWSESEVMKMHPRTYAKYEGEIALARKENRFDYDLSN